MPEVPAGSGAAWTVTSSPGDAETSPPTRGRKMLESLLALDGLLLLRDSVQWEGRNLLKALVRKAALCGHRVHVLGCDVSEEEFREGLASNINSRLVYHDLFSDPLGWSGTEGAFVGDVLGTLRDMCRKTEPGPITIALDSLSWLLLHFSCTTVCQTLHSLSHQVSSPGDHSPVKQVRVLGLLHEELHSPSLVGALRSLAQSETQWFSILPDFTVSLQRGPSLESQPLDPHKHQVDPMSHLTFNLHLSEKEKEAKDSLVLPFHFSSEKQQALLHPGPGQATSHIFYEPDAYDDLDQEDPDDDLDV